MALKIHLLLRWPQSHINWRSTFNSISLNYLSFAETKYTLILNTYLHQNLNKMDWVTSIQFCSMDKWQKYLYYFTNICYPLPPYPQFSFKIQCFHTSKVDWIKSIQFCSIYKWRKYLYYFTNIYYSLPPFPQLII